MLVLNDLFMINVYVNENELSDAVYLHGDRNDLSKGLPGKLCSFVSYEATLPATREAYAPHNR